MEGSAERNNAIYNFDKQYIEDLKREKGLKSFTLKDYLPNQIKIDSQKARNHSVLTTQGIQTQSTLIQSSACETATFKALQRHYTQDKATSGLSTQPISRVVLPTFHSLNSAHVS
jgi:hypothetical protein